MRKRNQDGELVVGCGFMGCFLLFWAGWIVFLIWVIITVVNWLTQQTL